MKIGIDYRPALLSLTGIGRYTREIAAAMGEQLGPGEELRLFGPAFARPMAAFAPQRRAVNAAAVSLIQRRFPSRLLHLLGRAGLAGVETFTGPLDRFLYTDLVYPPLKGTPHAVMVHDLAFLVSESFHGSGFGRRVWKRMEPRLASAGAVLAPSPCTADDLVRRLPACKGRVHVVPHGSDHLMREQPDAAGPALPEAPFPAYFLAAGTFEPRKNWERVLAAFEGAQDALGEAGLVFAGSPGWLCKNFLRSLAASPARSRIRLVLAPTDSQLAALYRGSLGLVYPALYEGFGLPVAEAFALGCPVITSNRSSLPWVAKSAALLVDPEDVAAIRGAMRRLAQDQGLRRELAERGRDRARELTWQKSGLATLEILRQARH